jgi:tRNA-Thr(GGU) m(6)t(6)A37 methyltransferase TsaA
MYGMRQVGVVRSPFNETSQIPKGRGAEHEAEGFIEFEPEFEPGLTDIEGFSHLYVIWVFHSAAGYDLLFIPPTDDRPHGVFATRSPRRPNPLGLTVVRLLGREGLALRVRGRQDWVHVSSTEKLTLLVHDRRRGQMCCERLVKDFVQLENALTQFL